MDRHRFFSSAIVVLQQLSAHSCPIFVSRQSAASLIPTGCTSKSQKQPGNPPLPSAARSIPKVDAAWPREVERGGEKVAMFQPQLEAWEGEELRAYAAISVAKKDSTDNAKDNARKDNPPKYGVVWFTARTEVDKVNRQVTLDNFQITAVNFPTMKDREAEYKAFLQTKLPAKSKVIALDRLEAGLEATDAGQPASKGVPVNNDPPRVIFATKPSMLVLVDGHPKFRDVGGTDLQNVLNTQPVILLDTKKIKYYLNVMDGWLEASDLTARPWSYVSKIPKDMEEITKAIKERQEKSASEGSTLPLLKQAKKEGKIPEIYVSLEPAELLVTEGQPQFERIPGLNLDYVRNTSANIFLESSTRYHYILIAGRWFRSKSLESGPWEFVDGQNLPQDFSKIPENSPKAGVLASVPGTAPAKEALIANSIPQTATITRNQAQLEVKYDGPPQFKKIEGTELQYAVNTATPVIQVNDKNYYAVENAVWFAGPAATGRWGVATTIPTAIYSIPPTAPLHYVTYVKVYDSTPEVVHVGYTPGYYGTAVSSTTTTVVYGTGFYYPPYVGTYWYGAPYTYGVGVASTWSSGSGWSMMIGVGYTYGAFYYPWWDHGATTGPVVGVRPGAMGGEAMPVPMCTVAGAILHMPIHGLPGPIPTREIMAVEAARLFKTLSVVRWELRAVELIPTSIPETRWAAGALQPTIPAREWLLPAARDMRATSTPGKASPAEAVSRTTQTRAEGSPRAATTCTQGRMVASIATTDKMASGHRTMATDGSPRTALTRACSNNSRRARRGSSARKTSVDQWGALEPAGAAEDNSISLIFPLAQRRQGLSALGPGAQIKRPVFGLFSLR
jgi:hypothetical protein